MRQQAAGFEGEPAQLRHSLTAGKSPAGQTHIWRNAFFPVVWNLCLTMCVWTVECAKAGACHIGSIINEHGLQGQLDQAWGSWVIWRVVVSGLLAQLCQLRWQNASELHDGMCVCVCVHTSMSAALHVCTRFCKNGSTGGKSSHMLDVDSRNKQAWN